jgi:hypothetical protein
MFSCLAVEWATTKTKLQGKHPGTLWLLAAAGHANHHIMTSKQATAEHCSMQCNQYKKWYGQPSNVDYTRETLSVRAIAVVQTTIAQPACKRLFAST